jgi:hypothetical protein
MKKSIFSTLLAILMVMGWTTSGYTENSDWKITLKVSGSGTYGFCRAGIMEIATDGFDPPWDGPAILSTLNESGPFIYVYFPHPEWADNSVYFAEDIKAPSLPKEWIFEITSNINGPLTITWPDLAEKLPAGYEAILVDTEGGGMLSVDMFESISFNFDNIANQARFFQVNIDLRTIPAIITFDLNYMIKSDHVKLIWDKSKNAEATQ